MAVAVAAGTNLLRERGAMAEDLTLFLVGLALFIGFLNLWMQRTRMVGPQKIDECCILVGGAGKEDRAPFLMVHHDPR
jgi:hypothetical protein